MSGPRPPRLAGWILSRRLSGGLGDAIRGDLEERWRREVRDRGWWAASLRYWREALSPSLSRVERDGRGLDAAPGTPIRSTRREGTMRGILRDVSYAVRTLGKAPAFTAVAVLSLALGIGPNTAVFSMVNAVLLRGPEGTEPERLVDIYSENEEGRAFYTGFWNVERLREGADDVFEGVAAMVMNAAALEEDGALREISYELVTGNYFDVLGIRPERGRFFIQGEDVAPGTNPVAVVSHAFWMNRLGGDPGAVGSDLRVNGRPYTVIGVAPEGFTGKFMPGVQADLWLPYSMYPHLAPNQPNNGNLGITARVRDDVPVERAVAAVDALSARIDADRKAEGATTDFVLRTFPWTDFYLHPDLDRPIVLMATLLHVVVGLVLLVACINLAGFFLARATDRRREVAVRLAMGAGRGAIVRQLLVEAVLLGALGGLLGLALGLWTARALTGLELPLPLPLALDVGLNPRVLVFTAGVSIAAGLLFGLTPALRASREPVASVLRDEGGAVTGRPGSARLRALMVGGQMALAVVLLVGAGLFLRSFAAATDVDPGFDTGPAAVVEVSAGSSGYESESDVLPLLEQVMPDLEQDPTVDRAALVTRMPLTLGSWVRFYDVPGVPPPEGRDNHRLEYAAVSREYFDVMGIPVVEGRGFAPEDGADGVPVTVVSRALARELWPGESALGRTLLPTNDPDSPVTVVGVAEDVKIWSLSEAPRPYLYLPFDQAPSTFFNVVARGSAAPGELGTAVHDAIRRADPDVFVSRIQSMRGHLAYILFLPRMAATLIGAFALLALTLAAIGLYGVVSYSVAARTREMGIRISLGADRASVVRLVMRNGLALTGAGAVLGVIAALVGTRFVSRFLIGVGPWDPLTLVGVPIALLAVAATAAFIPARRASRVDPAEALRQE